LITRSGVLGSCGTTCSACCGADDALGWRESEAPPPRAAPPPPPFALPGGGTSSAALVASTLAR